MNQEVADLSGSGTWSSAYKIFYGKYGIGKFELGDRR